MMSTTEKGNQTEAIFLGALMRSGRPVLVPFGGGLRYDMVFEEDGKFLRVQCKTGKLENGVIVFATSNVQRDTRKNRSYVGEIDYFGVYCFETDAAYLVPIEDVGGRAGSLRVEAPRNGQVQRIRWAKDYQIN